MRLSYAQYEFIKETIVDTFIHYGIKGIPINAFEVAYKLGLKIIPYSALSKRGKELSLKKSKDGFSLILNDVNWTIYYNDECNNYGRINHTIMHEIAHYILGHVEEGEEEEAEANFFAKYALAPPPLINNMKCPKTADNIAEAFDISKEAAEYALDYYKKWRIYGYSYLISYEIKLLKQFDIA